MLSVGEDPLIMMDPDLLPQLPDSLGFCCGSPIPSSTPEHNTWSKAVVRGGRNSLGGRDAGAKLSATGVRSRQDCSTRSAGHLCDEDGVRIEDIDGKSVIKEDALKQLKQQLWVEEGGYCIIPTSTTSAATFPELLERLLCDHSLHQVKHEEGLHAVVDLFMCSNSIFQDFDRNKNPLTDGDQRQMIVIDEAEAVVSHYVDSQTVESCIVHPQDLHVGLSNDVMTSNQILSDIQKLFVYPGSHKAAQTLVRFSAWNEDDAAEGGDGRGFVKGSRSRDTDKLDKEATSQLQ
ncbi:hypothetical protein CEUSTIGMA_g12336.t1 [Chlamydomonas eustigma]|uniref:Uncharacterized protein n=1 Tax=Chlamydomonas eustigma TaxID=1157962 RepID=A0A250XPA9_9CHLO|nr:hypothetical protein CEUSTIGMA_g12336.t1 [Chlamydomonas eustigma]|eukprot:GAX84915.1 hypothetical protein CEUSTIGMA_g12336.t1 [Chlamydomonas eustigma]